MVDDMLSCAALLRSGVGRLSVLVIVTLTVVGCARVAVEPEGDRPTPSQSSLPTALTEPPGETATARPRSGENVLAAGVEYGIVRLDTATGLAAEVVAGGPPADVRGPWERTPFHWSPSGGTVVSGVCGPNSCAVDILRTADWTATRIVQFVPHATNDDFMLGYPSLDDRGWRLLDLDTGESVPVAPEVAAAYDGYARDDGRFVAYGATSWQPEVPPVRRPIYLVDPGSFGAELIADQAPDDWGYLFIGWTTPNWVLLVGQDHQTYSLIDVDTGDRTQFRLEDGRITAP